MRLSLILLIMGAACTLAQMEPPVGADSGMASLTKGPDGAVYLTWIDTLGEAGHALRVARRKDGKWGAAETIAQGKGWFVNWADFPSLTVAADGTMLAHWLTRYGAGGRYGYGIRVARREASGWRQIHGMALDEREDYAGFLTFARGERAAIYLAPPAVHEAGHRKTVHFIEFGADGKVKRDVEVDADACSCCQTAIGRTAKGWVLAYRDHAAGEIRDIAITREIDGKWQTPVPVHEDGWKINGCPTDGPTMVTAGNRVAVTWLTRAQDQPRIQLAISSNSGASFGAPVRIDDGKGFGRPGIEMLPDGRLAVVWLERNSDEKVGIRLRLIDRDGKPGASRQVAEAPLGRGAGFPRLVHDGGQLLVIWRDGKVRSALVEIDAIRSEAGAQGVQNAQDVNRLLQ